MKLSKNYFRFYLLCSLILITLGLVKSQNIFVDPTSLNPMETGDFEYPFRNLSSAFLQLEKTIDLLELKNIYSRPINLYLKEDTVFDSFGELNLRISLEKIVLRGQTVRIQAYSSTRNPELKPKPAIFLFSKASDHLIIRTDLSIEFSNIRFHFDIDGKIDHSELILIEMINSVKSVMRNCEFSGLKVRSQDQNSAILRLNGRLHIEKSVFQDFSSNIPFIYSEGGMKTNRVAFYQNVIKNITLNETSFIKVKNIFGISLDNNLIEKTNGVLVDVQGSESGSFAENTFVDLQGKFPLRFDQVLNFISIHDTISFTISEVSHPSLIFLQDAPRVSFLRLSLEGYRGTSPAITISQKENLLSTSVPNFLSFKNSIFKKNQVHIQASEKIPGITPSLVTVEMNSNHTIIVEDCSFSENSIVRQDKTVGVFKGSSTFWIEAPNSLVAITNSNFIENKVQEPFKNIYVNALKLTVENTIFSQNSSLAQSKTHCEHPEKECSSLVLLGQESSFQGNVFENNYSKKDNLSVKQQGTFLP